MRKNIWFINQYIETPKTSNATHRHYALAKQLVKENDVTLFTGSFSHLHKNETDSVVTIEEQITVVNLEICSYRNTIQRVLNMFDFVRKLRYFNYETLNKPDVIVISTMSLFPLLLIKFYKKKFKGVKVIHETRDIWPLTPIQLGGYSKYHPFIQLLFYLEKLGYKKADYFVSNLENMNERISEVLGKEEKKFTWVSNGIDNQMKFEKISDTISEQLPKGKLLVGYAGTLGLANTMDIVVEAFEEVKKLNIYLCIIGSGEQEEYLKKIAPDNVLFLGRIPKNQVLDFLGRMDVCILSWRKIPLYKYGISPNKIFDYMFAEKPIIMCGDVPNSIVEKSGCGWVVPAENKKELSSLLVKISELDKKTLQDYGERAKKYLDLNFTYSTLALKYQQVFDKLM